MGCCFVEILLTPGTYREADGQEQGLLYKALPLPRIEESWDLLCFACVSLQDVARYYKKGAKRNFLYGPYSVLRHKLLLWSPQTYRLLLTKVRILQVCEGYSMWGVRALRWVYTQKMLKSFGNKGFYCFYYSASSFCHSAERSVVVKVSIPRYEHNKKRRLYELLRIEREALNNLAFLNASEYLCCNFSLVLEAMPGSDLCKLIAKSLNLRPINGNKNRRFC